jgi:hypothetical protein
LETTEAWLLVKDIQFVLVSRHQEWSVDMIQPKNMHMHMAGSGNCCAECENRERSSISKSCQNKEGWHDSCAVVSCCRCRNSRKRLQASKKYMLFYFQSRIANITKLLSTIYFY